MQKLKTGDSFKDGDYKVTRLGASKEGSESDWALFCVETNCNDKCEDGKCESSKVNLWVKKGHSFGVGDKACKLEESNREESHLCEGDPGEVGC